MTAAENIALHIQRGAEEGELSPKLALKYALELIYIMHQSYEEPNPDPDDATPQVWKLNSRLIKRLGW